MENLTMGKVLVTAKMENIGDVLSAMDGKLPPDQVRAVEVTDALVDTGAAMLSMPRRLIEKLGLKRFRTRRVRTSAGLVDVGIYGTLRLTVQGRDCSVDVAEVPDDCPVLIGQIPLEALDWVVDPIGGKLIGNPDHGGEHMIDLFAVEI